MAIHFSREQWEQLEKNTDLWWEHKLDRPLIHVQIADAFDPGRPEPEAPLLSQKTALDLSWSADALIDRIDYELSKMEYLGDGYPYFNMDCFGPGVLSAFLGARPDNRTGNIWFHPQEELELEEMHFSYDPDNIWFNRVKDIYRAANRRWNGQVVMGMVDLGGIMDVLAVFRGTQNLLMDLLDEPDEVKRLVRELHALWMRYYDELCTIMEESCRGYSDWGRIFSTKRSYIIQSDFSFMVSNPMFREFILDELRMCTEELDRTIYHLDGPGELKHLKDLAALPQLDAIQWIPGEGAPDQTHWPEVYETIHEAGKNIQLFHGYDCMRTVEKQIGTLKGVHHFNPFGDEAVKDRAMHVKNLQSFGLDVQE